MCKEAYSDKKFMLKPLPDPYTRNWKISKHEFQVISLEGASDALLYQFKEYISSFLSQNKLGCKKSKLHGWKSLPIKLPLKYTKSFMMKLLFYDIKLYDDEWFKTGTAFSPKLYKT